MKSIELCSECESPILPTGVLCEVCQAPVGFPNVRRAIQEDSALEQRYKLEIASVKTRNIEDVALKFQEAVDGANVVMARSVMDFLNIVKNDNLLISTFHQQVASGARLAENNAYDPKRTAIESLVHPFYYDKIHYAALSLDSTGVTYYGEAHIKLKNKFISKRTSFFEENAFNLVTKLGLVMGEDFPEGYRSTWEKKGKLALCKYHANLNKDACGIKDFQDILLVDKAESDFIEAHIFGNIHVKCVDSVTLLPTVNLSGKVMFEAHRGMLANMNINVDIRTS
jgi:hypothetical protein